MSVSILSCVWALLFMVARSTATLWISFLQLNRLVPRVHPYLDTGVFSGRPNIGSTIGYLVVLLTFHASSPDSDRTPVDFRTSPPAVVTAGVRLEWSEGNHYIVILILQEASNCMG
jgi:hypothetical protein